MLRQVSLVPDTPDDVALRYAANKFGVLECDIEVERTGGCVHARVVEDDGMEILTFEEYLHCKYPLPNKGDKWYSYYNSYGYRPYLVVAYPETWNRCGITWGEMEREEEIDYLWSYIEMILGCALDADAIMHALQGNHIILLRRTPACLGMLGFQITPNKGVEIADTDNGSICLFVGSDDNLIPVQLHGCDYHECSDQYFSAWEDIC